MGFLTINPLATDPSIVFVIFVISLWVGVTAAHLPGTGILEVLAFIGTILSFIILFQMPTNWLAVLVMVIGVAGYTIMPFIKHEYFVLAWGGILLQGAGGLFLFHGMMVSPFVIIVVMLLLAAYCYYILLPALRVGMNVSNATRDDELVGVIGRVTSDINPTGTVLVDSEAWTATSDVPIKTGERVVVIERNGLQLVVESVKRKRADHEEITETAEENNS